MRKFLTFLLACCASAVSASPAAQPFDNSAKNLMVVLRESPGENRPGETLTPIGTIKARLANGKEVAIDSGWYAYIGDMHLRFVFDTPASMLNASQDDLKRLGLSPDAALALAVSNIKRVYGPPAATPWSGLMKVGGKTPDLDSSYFLDRAF